jgi:uncharacterized protein HemY
MNWPERNEAARFLVLCPDPRAHHTKEAVATAEFFAKVLGGKDVLGPVWNTLGVTRYRAGDWRGAITALEKSAKQGGESPDLLFFLAMAHARLGDKEKARQLYDKAVAGMDKNKPQEELRHFRAEAAALLGIEQQPKGKETSPRKE